MQISVTPSGVEAFCAFMTLLIFVLAAILGSYFRGIVRKANDEQFKQINGTYVRSAGCTMTGAEIARRLDESEERYDKLSAYAHTSRHELANAIQLLHARARNTEQ